MNVYRNLSPLQSGMEALCLLYYKPIENLNGSKLHINMEAHCASAWRPFAQANTYVNGSPLHIEMDSLYALEGKPIAYLNRSPLHIGKEAISIFASI